MRNRKTMKIFIVGGGNIGRALARQLVNDGYELTVIDRDESVIVSLGNSMDIICLQGNGASCATLQEMNVSAADIFVSVTNSDEMNILSCLTAHMLGAKHTIARIRDVDYARRYRFYRDKMGISMIINPELATAMEIYRLLRFPLATRVEVFAKGRAELVEMMIEEDSPLTDKTLIEISQNMGINLLICAVVRDEEAFVPKGDTVIHAGDVLYMTGAVQEFRKAFKKLNLPIKPMKSIMIAGGGIISYYLAELLLQHGTKVTLVEQNEEEAALIAEKLDGVNVICDDALAYFDNMSQSDIAHTDAFITLTENDEYNLVAAMYAESKDISKVISRVKMKSRLHVLPDDSKVCIVSREDVATDRILGYSRSLLNAEDNDAVESLYRLMDGKIEFIEFKVDENDKNLDIPLKNLKMKRNMLIGCIIRDAKILIPRGDDVIKAGDTVLVATINSQIARLEDIFSA